MKTISNLDIFKEIKERISIIDAFKFYGVPLTKNNKALCIFHTEKTPSLVLYPKSNSFYCFGCGVGGSAIDLVQNLYNLDYPLESAKKIDSDFGLNLFKSKPTREELNNYYQREKQIQVEKAYKKWEEEYLEYLAKNIVLYRKLADCSKPSSRTEEIAEDFKTAIDKLQVLEYHWELLFNGSTEEKVHLYLAFNKVVPLF